ncbi:baseplate hub protein [Phascolarctobacterium sp.]|uniref:baseplate hub domain-containing protein n=1 Tax=Phascolarctobacterium sp. TaxID=2049039 RepID=UPI002A80F4D3|nr:DUF2163 domain-containing protein [Phascolarctobacterium sp.]MDY5045517.1 DUF2163 domain-containing protein [Phascolarctobacterium sp.]
MKSVNSKLDEYLNAEVHFETCDMYSLKLSNGKIYYIASRDTDVIWNSKTWKHNLFLLSRDKIKLQGAPTVDTLDVNVKCDKNDVIEGMPFILACHKGLLDKAVLSLYKAYFKDGKCVDVYKIFEGLVEIASAGGMNVKLSVKSVVQGLNQSIPIRIFAPQSAYTSNSSGAIVSSSVDTYTMLIPLKPSGRVLIKM